jgi:hypothetical protein
MLYITSNLNVEQDIRYPFLPYIRYPAFKLAGYQPKPTNGASLIATLQNKLRNNFIMLKAVLRSRIYSDPDPNFGDRI